MSASVVDCRRQALASLGYVCVLQGGGAGVREGRDMVTVSVGSVEGVEVLHIEGGRVGRRRDMRGRGGRWSDISQEVVVTHLKLCCNQQWPCI